MEKAQKLENKRVLMKQQKVYLSKSIYESCWGDNSITDPPTKLKTTPIGNFVWDQTSGEPNKIPTIDIVGTRMHFFSANLIKTLRYYQELIWKMTDLDISTETITSLNGKKNNSKKRERDEEEDEDQTFDAIVSQHKPLKFKDPLVR